MIFFSTIFYLPLQNGNSQQIRNIVVSFQEPNTASTAIYRIRYENTKYKSINEVSSFTLQEVNVTHCIEIVLDELQHKTI